MDPQLPAEGRLSIVVPLDGPRPRLLHEVKVAPVVGSVTREWIPIKRGVKQGCPLSPLLFIVALDPLLRELEKAGHDCYAYADDMAVYLQVQHLQGLETVIPIIQAFESISGLHINGKKSGLLPTCPPSEADKSYLASLQAWDGMSFVTSATYLGILMGAEVTLEDIFQDTVEKAKARLNSYHAALKLLPLYKKVIRHQHLY